MKEKETEKIESKHILFSIKTKIKNYVLREPRKVYFIMIGICLFSIIYNLGSYFYTESVVKPEYEEMMKSSLIKGAKSNLSMPVKAIENVSDMKQDLKELDYYKNKDVLTKKDSLRIKYLIDKY